MENDRQTISSGDVRRKTDEKEERQTRDVEEHPRALSERLRCCAFFVAYRIDRSSDKLHNRIVDSDLFDGL
jgi:hypothetical protein